MKATESFEKIISEHLLLVCYKDPLFAEKFRNPKKNIKDCITYILNTVKASGMEGFADDEIFGMATHYYDEENINVGDPIKTKIVVNRIPELSDEEIELAKKEAREGIVKEEMERLKHKRKAKLVQNANPSLFD